MKTILSLLHPLILLPHLLIFLIVGLIKPNIFIKKAKWKRLIIFLIFILLFIVSTFLINIFSLPLHRYLYPK